jgi:hypothetical protein
VENENRAVARKSDDPAPVLDGVLVEPDPQDVVLDLGRFIGRAEGYRHVSLAAKERELATLLEIKTRKLYRATGLSWEEFCQQRLGRGRQQVDEEIAGYRVLGVELLHVAELVGLTRDGLRELRALPADELPRLTAGGRAVQFGQEELPLETPADRERVLQRLTELLEAERTDRKSADAGREAAEARAKEAESRAEKLQGVINAGERELDAARAQLNSMSLLQGELLDRDAPIDEVLRRLMQIFLHLGSVADYVETTRPDRDIVLRGARPIHQVLDRLLRYGGNVQDEPGTGAWSGAFPEPALDFQALDAFRAAHPDSPLDD